MSIKEQSYKKKMEVFLADKPKLSKTFMKYIGNDDEFFSYSNLKTRESIKIEVYKDNK